MMAAATQKAGSMSGLKVWDGRIGNERFLVCEATRQDAVKQLADKGYVLTNSRFRGHWRVTTERAVLDFATAPGVWRLVPSGWARL